MHIFWTKNALILESAGRQASGRGVTKGGGYGGQNPPPHWPKFFGHFTQNSNKMMIWCVSAELPFPQNPLLRQFP